MSHCSDAERGAQQAEAASSGSQGMPTLKALSTAPSSSRAVSKDQSKTGRGGGWLCWPDVIAPLIVLNITVSVFPHQWLDERPWANCLSLLCPGFSSESKFHVKIKEHRVQKSYGRVKEICIFRNLFEQLTLTYWGGYAIHPLCKPWTCRWLPLTAYHPWRGGLK